MKTDEFVSNLEQAKARLSAVGVALAACRAKGTLGRETYAFFGSFPSLQQQLSDVINMLELREMRKGSATVLGNKRKLRIF